MHLKNKNNNKKMGKISLFQGRIQKERGGHKERVKVTEYDGCILYSYMKIEG
jgi:hypothetical protein